MLKNKESMAMSLESLSRAYELTQAMSAAAAVGDWPRAAELAEQRSPLLMALAPAQTPEALAMIRAIQELDAALARKTHDERGAIANRFVEAMKGIAAASFYQATGKLI